MDIKDFLFHKVSHSILAILILVTLSACAGISYKQGGTEPLSAGSNTDQIPGKEEFGMNKQELYAAIENVEVKISQCMSAAGFEYIAADYNTVRRGMVADKSLPGMSNREFITQYGYGISTTYSGLAPQLSDLATPAQIGLGTQNVEIFRNLSPADQIAYSHTLFGEHPDATFAVGLETENFARTGGCTRSAIEKYFSTEEMNVTYVNPFDVLVDNDPRVVAANDKYVSCLHDAGFDYTSERQIETDLRKKLDDITGGLPLDGLSSAAMAALTELKGYERALAAASTSCETKYLVPVANQVERELHAGGNQ